MVAGQVLTLLVSLLWAIFPGFGFIDLEGAVPPGIPAFETYWFLEGTWGLLVTALVTVGLLVAFLRPARARDVLRMLMVTAAAGALTAALTLDAAFLLLPVGLLLTAVCMAWPLKPLTETSRLRSAGVRRWPVFAMIGTYVVVPVILFGSEKVLNVRVLGILGATFGLAAWLAYAPDVSPTTEGWTNRPWPLVIVTVVGAGPWLVYGWTMAKAHREGWSYMAPSDRFAAESVLALVVIALPALGALGWSPLRHGAWASAVIGAGFGTFAIFYPHHLASPGATWGVLAIAWAITTLVSAEVAARHRAGTARMPKESGGFSRSPNSDA